MAANHPAHRARTLELVKQRCATAIEVENSASNITTKGLTYFVGEAVAKTYVHQICPRVFVSLGMSFVGWWAVAVAKDAGQITSETKAPTITFMVKVIGSLQTFLLVQWALRSMNRWWEARGFIGRIAGTLHLLAVQLALVQERCMAKHSARFEVSPELFEKYCGLLQSYMPLVIQKVHPTNRDQPAGWDDPRGLGSLDLTPSALDDHFSDDDRQEIKRSGYALVGHWLYMLVDDLHEKEILDVAIARAMYKNVCALHGASMGIEKIKNTPMPDLIKIGVAISTYLYCWVAFPMVLALQVQQDVDGWPDGYPRYFIIAFLVMIYFVTVQLIFVVYILGIHFEDPFGDDSYDLPLVKMTANVHKDINNVFHMALQHPIPDLMHPSDPTPGDKKRNRK